MTSTEDRARAAMRAIAGTIHDAPPLQLAPVQDASAADEVRLGRPDSRSLSPRPPGRMARRVRSGRDRRWRSLLAPIAAAVTVAAIAIALVLIKGIQNGSVVPASPPASAGLGGVPRYYVALGQPGTKTGAPNALLVGDTLTGKTIATLAPPADTSFQSVSGAADDRTFVVLDVANPGHSKLGQADTWYAVKLAPGTAHPATLTRLPIHSRFDEVVATALAGSGQELAVAGISSVAERGVEIFSLTTGRLLHDWTTNDSTALIPVSWVDGYVQWPVLTWIDGDRAITFTTISQASLSGTGTSYEETVRRLNVGGPLSGDLMADSQVIWPGSTASNFAKLPCVPLPPLVSADGKAITCYTYSTHPTSTSTSPSLTLTFRTYHLSARTTAAGLGTIAFQTTGQLPESGLSLSATLWTSPSGSTLIGEWAVGSGTSPTATPSPSGNGTSISASLTLNQSQINAGLRPAHIGVISGGKFTPLRLPPGFIPVSASGIAW